MLPVISLISSLYVIGQLSTDVYANEDNGKIQLESRNELLSLKVKNIPLGEVLEKLAESQGITFILKDSVEEPLSLELNDVALEEALKRVLHHKNIAILFDSRGTPSVVHILGMRTMNHVLLRYEPLRPHVENIHTEAETAESNRMITRVGMVEKKLAAASQAGSLETSAILQESLESPMPEVRTTALRWAMASKQSGPAALARALMDNHPMVKAWPGRCFLKRLPTK